MRATFEVPCRGKSTMRLPLSPCSSESPLTTTFSWAPSAGDAGGAVVILVTFTDPGSLSTVCSFGASVPAVPVNNS